MTEDTGVQMLEQAAIAARDYAPLPEFTDAMLCLIAKAVLGIIKGPISDQQETLRAIAVLAGRKE